MPILQDLILQYPKLDIKFHNQSFEISSMEVFSCEYFRGDSI